MIINVDSGLRLQGPGEPTLQTPASTQEITDKLSGLFAGQRLLAQIQSVLPNGAYRALINQRSLTLALPFAAKTGDAIELEVTASDGKLTLAVRTGKPTDAAGADQASATHFSKTGLLIRELLSHSRDGKAAAAGLPLNGNQPITEQPLRSGQELSPLLQRAIQQSGMFYEAHQAEWLAGRFAQADLAQEPQARLLAQATPAAPRNGTGAGSPQETPAFGIQANAATPLTTAAKSSSAMPAGLQDGVLPATGAHFEASVRYASQPAVSARSTAVSQLEPFSSFSPPAMMDSEGDRSHLRAALTMTGSFAGDARSSTESEPPSPDRVSAALEKTVLRQGAGDAALVSSASLSLPLAEVRQPAATAAMLQAAVSEPLTESVNPPIAKAEKAERADSVPASPDPSVSASFAETAPLHPPSDQNRQSLSRMLLAQATGAFENTSTAAPSAGEEIHLLAHKNLGDHGASLVVPQPLQSIVQQQLEAFATQHFSWQGQIWPGQQMQWEIDDQSLERDADGKRDDREKWQTRLRLILPKLGAVDARLQIHDQQMTLTLHADSAETRAMLRSQGGELRQQLENAGLTLAALGVVQSSD